MLYLYGYKTHQNKYYEKTHIDTSFYSEALQETKMVDIYFPPGYDENPDTYYSVIYYLHGWFGSQNGMNEMMSWMESLINNGIIEPVIMVGADNSPDPFDGSMYMNSIIWGDYEDYMINDLTKWLESSFRAYPSRDHRALLGISMGGYGTFRFGILHKDKFRVLAAAASQILNLTEVVLDSTRLHVLQQNQPGPPFFYDYDNSGSASTTMFMFLVFGAFAPNLNTPQTYINPPIVEFPLDENGDYIDTILMKAKINSIDHLMHQLYPEDSVGIFFGCGSGDESIYPCHIAFKDSLEMLGLPYEFYDHTGGHVMPAGFKERALIFMDSLLSPPETLPNSCLPQGITFSTQEQIDNFQINHPNCTEIEGDVEIDGIDITNLNGLSVLTSIGGELLIHTDYALTSLFGLENLASIGGELEIVDNIALTSLSGLENLTSIGGSLTIYANTALPSLYGLEGVDSIGESLWIETNDALASLSGLDSLASIGGVLSIGQNSALTSLTGLEYLTSIGGDVWIQQNAALTSLTGLENLTSIGGDLWIQQNAALTSLSGLEGLSSIGGNLYIGGLETGNQALTSLSGLENIAAESIVNLCIIENSLLSTCHVHSICEYLSSPTGLMEIYNNAPGCNSPDEVQDSCDVIPYVENRTIHHGLNISPNPMNDYAMLSLHLSTSATIEICIYNVTGICTKNWKYKAESPGEHAYYLNLAELSRGVYFCKVQLGDRVIVRKIIKQ